MNILPVSYSNNIDNEGVIFDTVYDAVRPLPKAVALPTGQLSTALGPRVGCQVLNSLYDPLPIFFPRNGFDLFNGGGFNQELISGHAFLSP